jgi:hypothetical protein
MVKKRDIGNGRGSLYFLFWMGVWIWIWLIGRGFFGGWRGAYVCGVLDSWMGREWRSWFEGWYNTDCPGFEKKKHDTWMVLMGFIGGVVHLGVGKEY